MIYAKMNIDRKLFEEELPVCSFPRSLLMELRAEVCTLPTSC